MCTSVGISLEGTSKHQRRLLRTVMMSDKETVEATRSKATRRLMVSLGVTSEDTIINARMRGTLKVNRFGQQVREDQMFSRTV